MTVTQVLDIITRKGKIMWSIACLQNNLKISKKCAKELHEESERQGDEMWFEVEDVTDEHGCVTFNSDHMEHMDFLNIEEYQNIIKQNNSKGTVKFGSLAGDNFGDFWGYEFDGAGNVKQLKGSISWEEALP